MDDSLTFGVPCTLLDFFRQAAAQLKKQRDRGQAPKRRAKRGSAAEITAGPRYLSLVEGDGLFFVVSSRSPSTATEDSFRDAFHAVWRRVPEGDRQTLLAYWRDRSHLAAYGVPLAPPPRWPLIRLVDDLPGDTPQFDCAKCGFELTFCASRFTPVIARALAAVHRFATRRHWALIAEKIDGPLARWEQRQGKNADEATRNAKIDRLEKGHLRKHEAEIARILADWGFKESDAQKERKASR